MHNIQSKFNHFIFYPYLKKQKPIHKPLKTTIMTDKQENKRSMYIAVQNVCNENQIIWSSLPAFTNAMNEFETILAQIEAQSQIQEGRTTGITQNKQKEEDEMIQITVQIAAAVYAYASKIGDNELTDKVNYSPSTLRQSRDTVLKDICQRIHDEANNVIIELADYGKSPEDLIQQQNEIDDFAAIIAKPRTAIGTRATATTRLVELFSQADDLLKNQMDKLMVTYQNAQAVFYNQYQSARTIVDLGVRHNQDTPPQT